MRRGESSSVSIFQASLYADTAGSLGAWPHRSAARTNPMRTSLRIRSGDLGATPHMCSRVGAFESLVPVDEVLYRLGLGQIVGVVRQSFGLVTNVLASLLPQFHCHTGQLDRSLSGAPVGGVPHPGIDHAPQLARVIARCTGSQV